ncbi:MAG: hypothetical protein RL885_01025 [Planctomycetota bacterium]
MNHRALQRTLFRMQLDHDFARRILDGDRASLETTGLSPTEAALLQSAPFAGITADPGNQRRDQVLGNASSELRLSVAAAAVTRGADVARGFLASEQFHDAIRCDGRLPFAFADYLESALEGADARLRSLVRLERELLRARREDIHRERPMPGDVVLAKTARLIELAPGTWRYAELLHARLERGTPIAPGAVGSDDSDWILILSKPGDGPLRDVETEPLQPMVVAVLRRAESPWPASARAELARELGVEAAELESFIDDLASDGVLVRG